MNVTVAGETLALRADKTTSWPAGRALFLADVHFGKPESFRRLGIPAAGDATGRTLATVDRALRETGAERLIVLGDFWHAKGGKTADVIDAISAWRREHQSLDVTIVLGNHDFAAGGIPAEWGFTVSHVPVAMGPFLLAHEPMTSPVGYVLSGHIHPAVRIQGRGRQALRLPCFWLAESFAVLPAFGGYTGTAVIRPGRGDRVYAIADDDVISVTSEKLE